MFVDKPTLKCEINSGQLIHDFAIAPKIQDESTLYIPMFEI